jgi:hypothetical protein
MLMSAVYPTRSGYVAAPNAAAVRCDPCGDTYGMGNLSRRSLRRRLRSMNWYEVI